MTNRTAATRYARALLDVALQEKADLASVDAELAGFVDLVAGHDTIRKVLLNPAVPAPRKSAAVAEIARQGNVSPIVSRMLVLLAGRDRLALLPDVLATFRDRLMDYQKVVRAEVTTAEALAPERAHAIQARLAEVTGRTVLLSTKVDAALVGGLVARVGSVVYDGSITTQLHKMKARLAEGL